MEFIVMQSVPVSGSDWVNGGAIIVLVAFVGAALRYLMKTIENKDKEIITLRQTIADYNAKSAAKLEVLEQRIIGPKA